MTDQCSYLRRQVLVDGGTIVTTVLAGCSSSSDENSGDSEGGSREGTQSPETQSPNTQATETQTSETPTEAKSQFSTEGNDSELIDRPPEELNITEAIMPDGYTLKSQTTSDYSASSDSDRVFRLNDSTWLEARVEVHDEVSSAKTRYGETGLSYSFSVRDLPDKTKDLNIAVESEFESGSLDEWSACLLKIRDANTYGHLLWKGGSQEPLELQVVGNIAVTMHQKWR